MGPGVGVMGKRALNCGGWGFVKEGPNVRKGALKKGKKGVERRMDPTQMG